MLKKFFIILFASLLMIGVSETVFASDTQTATSTINDVTLNWSYKLNESNQIEELKCTNTSDLTGIITVPSTINEKTVVTLGNEAFKSATQITEVIIPNTVKEIQYKAFENCTNLSKVNLGSIEKISFDVFKGCTNLTEITIPKTLKNGGISPCLNNSNITKITLEEGLTIVPSCLCANTGITEITIPNTVKNIEYSAFENCTNLSKVNLGSIEKISFDVFKGCTNLTEITIPKTLKNGGISPCLNNSNITKITLEEGLTIVPSCLCANTGITEITIPNTVKKIEYSAFDNCANLKKITILNNVTEMGFYNSNNSDSIFKNHSQDLTIYCYKDSMAAKYAIKYNINYVYLTEPVDTKPIEDGKGGDVETTKRDTPTETSKDANKKDDTTVATGRLPHTGVSMKTVFIIISTIAVVVIFYKKYSNYKDIK